MDKRTFKICETVLKSLESKESKNGGKMEWIKILLFAVMFVASIVAFFYGLYCGFWLEEYAKGLFYIVVGAVIIDAVDALMKAE